MSKELSEDLKQQLITESSQLLRKAGLISGGTNQLYVETHTNPVELKKALSVLSKAGILTSKNLEFVAGHDNPEKLFSGLNFLYSSQILNQKTLDLVAEYRGEPMTLYLSLALLKGQNILTEQNLKIVTEHSNPENLLRALDFLYLSEILDQKTLDFVAKHDNPFQLASALNSLKIGGLLNEKNLKFFDTHNGKDIAAIIENLYKANLLCQGNLDKASKCTEPLNLASSVASLKDKTEQQGKFDQLIQHLNPNRNPNPELVEQSKDPQKSNAIFKEKYRAVTNDNQTSSELTSSEDVEQDCVLVTKVTKVTNNDEEDYVLVDVSPKP
jgi:hypothetical protein